MNKEDFDKVAKLMWGLASIGKISRKNVLRIIKILEEETGK